MDALNFVRSQLGWPQRELSSIQSTGHIAPPVTLGPLAQLDSAEQRKIKIHELVVEYLHRSEGYQLLTDPDEWSYFSQVIGNDNNYNLLTKQLHNQVAVYFNTPIKKGEKLESEVLEAALQAIQRNFLINLQEAYLRSKEQAELIEEILSKQGLSNQRLTQIEALAGSDPHCGGKRACLLKFNCPTLELITSSGPIYSDQDAYVVYKPRDLSIESHLVNDDPESLFASINEIVNDRVLATYRIKCCSDQRGHFGFVEYIPRAFWLFEDKSGKEKERAYKRQQIEQGLDQVEVQDYFVRVGILQFAAQLFGITDLHRTNIIVSRDSSGKCWMYPIDLETAFDIRVLKDCYTTGLLLGMQTPDTQSTNFIITKNGISPRGHRELATHPKDVKAILEGFRFLQSKLSSDHAKSQLIKGAKRLYQLTHRFVPMPSANLITIIEALNTPLDALANLFVDQLRDRLKDSVKDANRLFTSDQAIKAIKACFNKNRRRADLPYFIISNQTGRVTLDGEWVATFEGIEDILPERIRKIDQLQIEKAYNSLYPHATNDQQTSEQDKEDPQED